MVSGIPAADIVNRTGIILYLKGNQRFKWESLKYLSLRLNESQINVVLHCIGIASPKKIAIFLSGLS